MTRQIVFFLCVLLSFPSLAFGLAEANDLDLEGASVIGFAQAGDTVYAVADSPRGIYSSTDFGQNWSFASGGDYEVGAGSAVVTTASGVFALLSRKLYASDLELAPTWSEVDLGLSEAVESQGIVQRELLDAEELFSLTTDGTFLFTASNHGKVRVVNASSVSLIETSTVVDLEDPKSLSSIAVDSTLGFVWVLVGEVAEANGVVYRNSYNTTTGAFTGTWTDVTPSLLKSNSGRGGGVFSDGAGILYVTTFGAGESDQGIYRSTDGGDSYGTPFVPSNPASSAELNIRGAAFRGTTHLVGRYISTDSGANFVDGTVGETPQGDLSNQWALLIDNDDGDAALASSDIGPIGTSDLTQGTSSTWGQRFTGLRGVTVNDFDQSTSDTGVVVLALQGGIARSTNFSDDPTVIETTPVEWTYPILTGDFAAPVFSVKLDPDNDDVIFAGSGTLYRGVVGVGDAVTWTDITSNSTPAKNIVDISIAGDKVLLATAQTSGALDGNVRVVSRSSLTLESTALDGLPVSAVYAISESIMYAGVGGMRTLESEGSLAENLGLYRSLDGGANWTQITSNSDLTQLGVSHLEYDSTKDILYVAALTPDSTEGEDEEEGESEENPNLFIIRKASEASVTIKKAKQGLPAGEVSALAFANKDGERKLYAAVDGDIFVSESAGKTWALFYDGLSEESVGVLFFDDLIRGSNVGFDGLSGLPNLIVSALKGKITGGSTKKVTVKFNRPIRGRRHAKRRVRASTSRGGKARARVSNDGSRVTFSPRGAWPISGSIRVRVKSTLQTEDEAETIDSDYDGSQGGATYRKSIRIR